MYQRILVPVDGSEPFRQALNEALPFARGLGDRPVVQVQVLHVLDNGSIAAAVLAEVSAGGADLIVMGTHGRKGLGRVVLGSVAEEVIRDSPVPVLLPGRRR